MPGGQNVDPTLSESSWPARSGHWRQHDGESDGPVEPGHDVCHCFGRLVSNQPSERSTRQRGVDAVAAPDLPAVRTIDPSAQRGVAWAPLPRPSFQPS